MAEGLWGIDELVKAAGGELIGMPRGAFTGVSIDSRSVGDNEIFVAIKGDRIDGHFLAMVVFIHFDGIPANT